jgi:CTP:molybdopterin cytidylyltransferase MocA
MGAPKLMLPFAGRTVVEHVVSRLRNGGVSDVVVVTGPHTLELRPLAMAAGAEVLALGDGTPDMRTTIEHGLRYLNQRHAPRPHDAFFLAPADHPAFNAHVVRRLWETYSASHAWSIVVPVHAGRRGHPSLIAWQHVSKIQAMPRDCGINAYLRQNPDEILELETDENGILFNLDLPQDYIALQRLERARDVIPCKSSR